MTLGGIFRWSLFAGSVLFFFTLPLALLWDRSGLVVGGLCAVSFLFCVGFKAEQRIAKRLGLNPLTTAEAPFVHTAVTEYCRRLGIPVPRLALMETPAINLAIFGRRFKNSCLAITRGALQRLEREQLFALIGRELTYLWFGEVFCQTWMSQFFSTIDYIVTPSIARPRRSYPFKIFLRQVLLFPLTLLPTYFLKSRRESSFFDLKSIRITRKPKALAEGLRRIEATEQRTPLQVPFSARHLFLISPVAQDPLARMFFRTEDLPVRIKLAENLREVVSLT